MDSLQSLGIFSLIPRWILTTTKKRSVAIFNCISYFATFCFAQHYLHGILDVHVFWCYPCYSRTTPNIWIITLCNIRNLAHIFPWDVNDSHTMVHLSCYYIMVLWFWLAQIEHALVANYEILVGIYVWDLGTLFFWDIGTFINNSQQNVRILVPWAHALSRRPQTYNEVSNEYV